MKNRFVRIYAFVGFLLIAFFCSPLVQAMDSEAGGSFKERSSSTKKLFHSLYEDIENSHFFAIANSRNEEYSEGHYVSKINLDQYPYITSSSIPWKECPLCIYMVKTRNNELEKIIKGGYKLVPNDAQDLESLGETNTFLMKENTNLTRENAELKQKITDLEVERDRIYNQTAERKEKPIFIPSIMSNNMKKYCSCGARYLGLGYCVACNEPRK